MTSPSEIASSPDSRAALRQERDRFVALAFCWADVLLELDPAKNLVFVTGATFPLLGLKPEDLVGKAFTDLAAKDAKAIAAKLLRMAERRGRIENTEIHLAGKAGATPRVSVAGYRLDDFGGHYFLALRSDPEALTSAHGEVLHRDLTTGLYDSKSFSEIAGERIAAARAVGEEAEMTLISLSGYDVLEDRLGRAQEAELHSTIGTTLRANSIDGDSAAEIGDGRYGLIHEGSLNVTDLEQQIARIVREADPTGNGVTVESATVDVGDSAMTDEELASGLVYAINKFRSARGSDFSLRDFSTNLTNMVGQAVQSVSDFRQVVESEEFEIAFHPIVDLRTGKIHHFEALVRFLAATPDASPFEYITFAEETGLIGNFDIAMANKVVDWLKHAPDEGFGVAVNISGQSMENMAFLTRLSSLLERNVWARPRLMFEITESARISNLAAANRFIQSLRGQGYKVCLDDFGAGAASFQYLSALEVDVVKLDGSAIQNAQRAPKGRVFLTALVRLCRDLGVQTIAEMVDNNSALQFVRECGVDFAQGYLFGRPNTNIAKFSEMRFVEMIADRKFGR